MINELQKEIDSINNNLSVLPVLTIKNKKEFNTYIDEQIEKYSKVLSDTETEINRRYDDYMKIYSSEDIMIFKQKLDVNSIKNVDSMFDSSEKMNLNYFIYELGHYYNDDLDKLNEIIFLLIGKFKEAGINLTLNDFKYTEVVYEYINCLLNKKENIHKVFEGLYWKNSNLVCQIELNFRFLYFKYQKKIEKFFKKYSSGKLNDIKEYINKKNLYEQYKHNNINYISNLFINKSFSTTDLSEKNIIPLINELLLKKEATDNYDNLLKFNTSLIEYKKLMDYMFIIDDLKSLYEKKQEYKLIYDNKYKEISKKEKELFKLNKKVVRNRDGQYKLNRNLCIDELYKLYKELDDLKILDYIFKNVNDNTCYLDLLKSATYNFNYFVKLLKKQNDDLTMNDLESKFYDLCEYLYSNEFNIINNISIVENKNIAQVISDRYRLSNINITDEKINIDDVDILLQKINMIITYYDISKCNIKLDDLDFILYVNKMREV